MTSDRLLPALRTLILQHLPSMDHVAVLIALRESPEEAVPDSDIVARTRLDGAVVASALRNLVDSRLVTQEGNSHRYTPPPDLNHVLEELEHMYRTKPVTLVRALYDRPARAVTSFADAFRVRKPE